jgi:protein O-GlcNAc transferase
MANLSEMFDQAVRFHQGGNRPGAESLYREILRIDPRNINALHLLGILANEVGRHDVGIPLLRQAIALNPSIPDLHANLGLALFEKGHLSEAADCFRQALRLEPGHADAVTNLGNVIWAQGRRDEAAKCFNQALRMRPGDANALFNLGNIYLQQEDFAQAAQYYRQALRSNPNQVDAQNNLGTALFWQGEFGDAAECFQQVLRINPNHADAHNNLGNVRFRQGLLKEAAVYIRQALRLKPDHANAHFNLGNVLVGLEQLAEATQCYRQAIRLDAKHADAHYHLGLALVAQEMFDEAAEFFRQAIRLSPEHADAHYNLGVIYFRNKQIVEAAECFREAARIKPDLSDAHFNLGLVYLGSKQFADAEASFEQVLQLDSMNASAHFHKGFTLWQKGQVAEAIACYRRTLEIQPEMENAHSNLLYSLLFCPDYTPDMIQEENRRWYEGHAQTLDREMHAHGNEADPKRRLRVGYVSPDFREHCQAFFTFPLLSSHNHVDCEIFCYSDVPKPDDTTNRLQSFANKWRNIAGKSDEQVADLIRQDRIDILVDLTMHMAKNRLLLFARKPAPVQVSWLAYPGSTGLRAIDYRFTDPHLEPPNRDDSHDSEKPVCLPDTFWCYDPLTGEPAVNELPALKNGFLTFGSFNNFCKVNTPTLKLWARVLNATDGARLIMLASEGECRRFVLDLMEHEGIEAERISFVANQPRDRYLAFYQQIDVGLDTLPYNGHTTTLDSLWMGIPVLTLVGKTAVGRAGLSILSNLGMSEWIAETPEQFVASARRLTADLTQLDRTRATSRQRMKVSPLMDAPRFARHVEAAYREMWRTWCARLNV